MKNNSLNKGILRVLTSMLILFSINVNAQSLTGTRGLIKAPTARMYESGTLAIGMGYIPAKFFKRTYGEFKGIRTGNPGLNTFITVNPLPFMEIMFRYSHELNMKVNQQTKYFPDRMFTARFRILEENKSRPSIVIGLQDISEALFLTSGGSNYSSAYVVGSKLIKLKNFHFDLSLGYSNDIRYLPAKSYKGIFGGVEIQYNEFKKAQLLIDYDTTSLNIGLQSYLLSRIHTVIGLMDLEPMFLLAYRYKI